MDARLVGGSALFGIGWGLTGYCPGPALVATGVGLEQAVAFVLAMGAGMALWSVAFIGSRPLAAAINGALADHVAIELAVLLSGALLLAGAVISRQPRGADQPGERRET